MESMQAAAKAMSDALQTALVLDHPERRTDKHRRKQDIMEDHCAFD